MIDKKPRIEVETYIMSREPCLKTYDILVTERLPDTSEVNLLEDFEGLGVDAVQTTLKGLGDKYPDAIFYDVTSFQTHPTPVSYTHLTLPTKRIV